jgi:hypothetical protein
MRISRSRLPETSQIKNGGWRSSGRRFQSRN